MIRFEGVFYKYKGGRRAAVEDVSLHLEDGSFHFLCGPSGAGKSTILKLLHMELMPTAGTLSVFGKNVKRMSRDDIARTRRRMGLVFQDSRLLPHLTVRENVSLPLTLHGRLSAEQEKCIDEILAWVGLGDKLGNSPESLSGGEQQRVSIARAVVNRPRLLIADEPSGNVDAAMAKRIMYLFTELNKHGTTVVIATHDSGLLRDFPYPCLHIREGCLLKQTRKAAA